MTVTGQIIPIVVTAKAARTDQSSVALRVPAVETPTGDHQDDTEITTVITQMRNTGGDIQMMNIREAAVAAIGLKRAENTMMTTQITPMRVTIRHIVPEGIVMITIVITQMMTTIAGVGIDPQGNLARSWKEMRGDLQRGVESIAQGHDLKILERRTGKEMVAKRERRTRRTRKRGTTKRTRAPQRKAPEVRLPRVHQNNLPMS